MFDPLKVWDVKLSQRSFIRFKKRSGSRIKNWRTPTVTLFREEDFPVTTTLFYMDKVSGKFSKFAAIPFYWNFPKTFWNIYKYSSSFISTNKSFINVLNQQNQLTSIPPEYTRKPKIKLVELIATFFSNRKYTDFYSIRKKDRII